MCDEPWNAREEEEDKRKNDETGAIEDYKKNDKDYQIDNNQ